MAMQNFMLQFRKKTVVNTDPQNRCYNGCHFSSETVWTAWNDLCPFDKEKDAEASAVSYKKINRFNEYRVVPIKIAP
jgi:hypothetical protein